jgi:WD40 repeat protein
MADVAEALQHAHDAGVLHRDLKPSNVMVDTQEQCWVIDFGLGGVVGASKGDAAQAGASGSPHAGPATASGVMGTPQYMAPEQVAGKVDARSDVWGLGVTLYELLALRRAFDGATAAEVFEQVLKGEPAPPRRWVRNVPENLAAICRKAMRKEPGERYATARAFAADVRRWLNGEVVEARGWQPVRRVARWARRHKGWAAAMVLMIGSVAGALMYQWRELQHFDRLARRHRLQQVIQDNGVAGWRQAAWVLMRAEAKLGTDDKLQALAVESLMGIDAVEEVTFEGVEAASVAFDHSGNRLLFGGHEKTSAHLWGDTEANPRPLKQTGAGPVAFTPEGTPIQVIVDPRDSHRLQMWDLEAARQIASFEMPKGDEVSHRSRRSPMVALTTDAHYLAAAGPRHVAIWRRGEGQPLRTWALPDTTALALTADGSLLAIGNAAGQLQVISVPGGEAVVSLPGEGVKVTALTFYPEVQRVPGGKDFPWGLVAGDAGSTVAVYDLGKGQLKTHCRGGEFQVEALAVSPDGMTLASSSARTCHLWDLATGKRILRFGGGELILGLAFSPDGGRIACASRRRFDNRGISSSMIWSLEQGRGLRILRGLTTPTPTVTFSPDGRLLAVLEHNWQVAVWDVEAGKLLHRIRVPAGLSGDNADLAFGPNDTLAFSAGQKAELYQLHANRVKRVWSWNLPPGLVDRFAEPKPDRLILARMETTTGEWGEWERHPRILRVYDLLRGQKPTVLTAIRDFNERVFEARISLDGRSLVASGSGGPRGETNSTTCYELPSGRIRWSIPYPPKRGSDTLPADPGRIVVGVSISDKLCELRSLGSDKPVGTPGPHIGVLGPAPHYLYAASTSREGVLTHLLGRWWDRDPMFVLPGGEQALLSDGRFDPSGRFLAWGNRNGEVVLCDLVQVQSELKALGIKWITIQMNPKRE